MILSIIESRFALPANAAVFILMFFSYSFLGYVLECIVLTVEKRHLVMDRGFVRRLPFCIIYGFGGMICYAALSPLKNNLAYLFVAGAIAATGFEFFVAQLQIRLFGDFWWDYTEKPFNFKGVLCLESTLGWGVVAIVIVRMLHGTLTMAVGKIPIRFALPLAVTLVVSYSLDFIFSARNAKKQSREVDAIELEMKYYNR